MAGHVLRQSCALLAVLCMIYQATAEDISAVTCNPDSGGTAECAAKDSNAECKTGEDKCSCAEKYIFKTDKSACTATISSVTCNPSSGGTATCEGANANAECKTDATTCSCKEGYVQDPDTENGCMKDTAVGKACTSNADCAADTNSECTDDTCSCKMNYMEMNSMCEKILGKACTSANEATVCKVNNSECNTDTCQCMTGYTEATAMCTMVLDMTCAQDSDCSTKLTNTACKTDKCACADNYVKEDIACKKAIEQACTVDTDCVSNAECDTGKKCMCKTDYKANSDKSVCEKGDSNAAESIAAPVVLLLASAFLTLKGIC